MSDVEDAVNAVMRHVERFKEILPSAELRLEEFEYDPDQDSWTITMSFDDPIGLTRSYRTFNVNRIGQVDSMKIRAPFLLREAS